MYFEDALCRFYDHSVSSFSNSRSPMKVSTIFSFFLALTVKKCLAGIIIETKKLDEDSIIKAAVSSSVYNFYIYLYSHFYPTSSAKGNSRIFFSARKLSPVLAETKIYKLKIKRIIKKKLILNKKHAN